MNENYLIKLKKWLGDHRDNFIDENEWCGDTEGGFHTEYEYNHVKLCAEIDEFHKTFEQK